MMVIPKFDFTAKMFYSKDQGETDIQILEAFVKSILKSITFILKIACWKKAKLVWNRMILVSWFLA